MTRQHFINEWTFKTAGGRNASHVCAWAPWDDIDSNVPTHFIDFPRGRRGMDDNELLLFCESWMVEHGLLEPEPPTSDPTEKVEFDLHFKGTRADFLLWLKSWEQR